jgi:hypothetical protein
VRNILIDKTQKKHNMYGVPSMVEEYDGEADMVQYTGWRNKKVIAASRRNKILIAAAVAAILLMTAKASAQSTVEPPEAQLQQTPLASPLVMAMLRSRHEPIQRPTQTDEVPIGASTPPANSKHNPSRTRERACMEQNRRGEWVQVPMRHCANLHTKKQ